MTAVRERILGAIMTLGPDASVDALASKANCRPADVRAVIDEKATPDDQLAFDVKPKGPVKFTTVRPRAARMQVGGDHYVSKEIQPWDAIDCWLTPEEVRGYHKGTAIGYLAREHDKGGTESIQKAHHHLTKLLEYLAERENE